MFTVTESARAHLSDMLATVETPENENAVLRMTQDHDGIGLVVSQEDPKDTTFPHEGVTVLVVDEELS
jgi:hypothetical protein